MEEKKRKTKTSISAVARYNKKTYDSIAVRIPKEMATAFKEKCSADGVSQAQVIKNAIQEYLNK